jgi:hypothetical protein
MAALWQERGDGVRDNGRWAPVEREDEGALRVMDSIRKLTRSEVKRDAQLVLRLCEVQDDSGSNPVSARAQRYNL